LLISHIGCSHSHCEFDEEENEAESIFEKFFWFFIIPSAILIAISIYLEFATEFLILSQICAIISIILSSSGVLKEAVSDIRNKKISANILMLIAAVASFFILHGQEGATAILLYAIAEYLEELTTEKSRRAIKELLELAPEESLLKVDGEFTSIPTSKVNKGDIIGIKPGMKIPLDGKVIKGTSYVDESAITGESIPIFKTKGDEVFAASMNSEGFFEIEVLREKQETVVAQIAESIKTAQKNKSKKERFIEKFAKYYTPLILMIALIIMIFPPIFFNVNFNDWFYRGLILLVVSCPCALTLSTPLANITALTKMAREGILVKGNRFLEKINDIELFAFDKTGTLTEGNLKVFQIFNYGIEKRDLLTIAASLEKLSEHPIGKAIVNYSKKLDIPIKNVKNFKIIKGRGIKGEIGGKKYYVGSKNFFKELNLELPSMVLNAIEENGTIPILLGNDKKIMGIITIRDVLRISAPILIDGLQNRGYKTLLISGDNRVVCKTIGECLNITNIYGELLPDQKLRKIEDLRKNGVAMVGDGINDAPALALSDLGIAIGASATDITLETADVIIMGDDLTKILTFIDLAKKTNKVIKQNIWTSIIIKFSFAILTVLGLMTLWIAVGIGDMGVSLLVMLNSMRLLGYSSKIKQLEHEKLESKARLLICNQCKIKKILPQHHGRDMIQQDKTLVCWKKLLHTDQLEYCEKEIPLYCPNCNNLLEVK
jgi:Cd2+/Zn2+-exporting ATPase